MRGHLPDSSFYTMSGYIRGADVDGYPLGMLCSGSYLVESRLLQLKALIHKLVFELLQQAKDALVIHDGSGWRARTSGPLEKTFLAHFSGSRDKQSTSHGHHIVLEFRSNLKLDKDPRDSQILTMPSRYRT